ncbi:hypothetical protein RvY_07833 [Ramazzottius varieornatus]|uniref:Uncharacterized protein n=1 Tax=Ramazzottius varieornatus TaxID=947166 RepID=A0A1D1VCZ5_RAMVA|nr:hypothetical protein RvY_07833 [Ramazzottius varieornatus]
MRKTRAEHSVKYPVDGEPMSANGGGSVVGTTVDPSTTPDVSPRAAIIRSNPGESEGY